ncbi:MULTISPECIES: PE domain-containing protein [unclassified Actinoplanes]|uniref:PE domain-containing protein n=1 Tax=unclassified Actinoplanes TaxID=2626549 RepID=UPI00155FAAEB|nr:MULTISPECIES: PE domain-containing protein [unclassified Actinoplanes]
MTGRLRLDPDRVADAGRDLAAIAGRIADDVTSLEAAVGGAHPWGADETSSVFALAYRAVAETALDAMASYAEQVGYAAAALVMQARSVAAADAEAASSLYAVSGLPGATPPVPGADPTTPTPAPAPNAPGGVTGENTGGSSAHPAPAPAPAPAPGVLTPAPGTVSSPGPAPSATGLTAPYSSGPTSAPASSGAGPAAARSGV